MKLETVRNTYYEATDTVSSRCREFSFGGLALIWLLKSNNPISELDNQLLWAAIFIILSLSIDMFQYLYRVIIWGSFHWYKEKNNNLQNKDFTAPNWFNYPTFILFWAKLLFLFKAYYILGQFMINITEL